VLYVPEAPGSLLGGAAHCTCGVHAPAWGVPCVPRTVAPQASICDTRLSNPNPNPNPSRVPWHPRLALAARLKQLSHRYNLAVVVTNQASRSTIGETLSTYYHLVLRVAYSEVVSGDP
jgi:hypothetical protein